MEEKKREGKRREGLPPLARDDAGGWLAGNTGWALVLWQVSVSTVPPMEDDA